MRIYIRLYRRHDMDLITLYKNRNFNFRRALKHALHAYIEKEPFLFYAPPSVPDMCKKDFNSCYRINVDLDEEKDADIIDFLDTAVRDRMRNAITKTIMRGCMVGTYAYAMVNNDVDRQLSDEKINEYIWKNYSLWTPPLRGRGSKRKIRKVEIEQKENEILPEENKEAKKTKKTKKKVPTEKTKKEKPEVVFVDDSSVKKEEQNQEIQTDDDFDLFGALGALSR